MTVATDKSTLIEEVRNGWWRLQRTLEQFTETEMDEIHIQGNWTVKDIVAHITFWERKLLGWLRQTEEGQPLTRPAQGYSGADIDRMNLENYQTHQQSPVHDVLGEAAQIHEELFAALLRLPEDPEDERYAVRQDGMTLWHLIAGNTYEHYEEHLRAFEAHFERTGRPGHEYPEGPV